jgi:tyrosyl-tRNA synthetase
MKINTDPKKIKDIMERRVEEIIESKSLESKLKSGKQLRIKFGVDPTGSKIHMGRAIQLWKLRAFQDLGHKVVLIIGDFTAQIGDASDKQSMRKPLNAKEVKENMKGYEKQIGRILDMSKVEVRYNNEWLGKLSMKDLLNLSMKFTAQQMIQRRNFKERWDSGKPIGLHELNYPLLQGYDSVIVKADVEIGGSDQLFNLKAGRELQRMFNQPQQDIMTQRMLFGLDGRKMSTSWGNVVTIVDSPNDMYGKLMSMKDELIIDYFELCTSFSLPDINEIKKDLENGKINPRELKAKLAKEIVRIYHGDKKASEAEKEFENVFKEKQVPTDIPEMKIKDIPPSDNLTAFIFNLGMAESKSEAQRLIQQKAVEIDGKTQTDWKAKPVIKKGIIIKVGKRKFVKLG